MHPVNIREATLLIFILTFLTFSAAAQKYKPITLSTKEELHFHKGSDGHYFKVGDGDYVRMRGSAKNLYPYIDSCSVAVVELQKYARQRNTQIISASIVGAAAVGFVITMFTTKNEYDFLSTDKAPFVVLALAALFPSIICGQTKDAHLYKAVEHYNQFASLKKTSLLHLLHPYKTGIGINDVAGSTFVLKAQWRF